MSSATPPEIQFAVSCKCNTCGKELYSQVTSTEDEFKEATAKAITASELHDCKATPKGAGS